MTDREYEKYLADAIARNTPDILDELLNEIGREDNPEPGMKTLLLDGTEDAAPDETVPANGFTAVRRRRITAVISAAAAMLIAVCGIGVLRSSMQTFAIVGLDVNPGIELSVNKNERVVEVKPVNEDGENILEDMDLKGTDLNTACNAIIGSMLTKGYLTDLSNSILVSVRSDDEGKGREIEKALSDDINAYLENSTIAASIMSQYIEDDDELEAFAAANGISAGKAWLIRNLLATGSPNMTEESLLRLSTQELILLGQQRQARGSTSYGQADTSKYIGSSRAIDLACEHAGINRSQASHVRTEYDTEDGKIVYEVDFIYSGREYEYDIDASNGKILSYEVEKTKPGKSSGTSKYSKDDRDDDDDDDDDDRYDDRDDDDDDDDDDD